MKFSRPCGTRAGADEYPALKRRAIVGLSRWDERGRVVAHSECRRGNLSRRNQMKAGGSRRLGARSLAMTEIRLVVLKSHEIT
jgi:hypothetical protein